MALHRRGQVWHMDYSLDDKRFRRSLKTEDRRVAKKIEAKIKTQLIEGKWLDTLPGREKTFKEMMERYMKSYPLQKFVTHYFPVEKAEEALKFSMTDECMKVVVAAEEFLKG